MPGAPQQPSNEDHSTTILWFIAALFAVIGVIWIFFKTYIVTFYLKLKLGEIAFLSFFGGAARFKPIADHIHTVVVNPATVTLADLMKIGDSVGDVLRYPIALILFILAFVVYFGNSTRVFKRTYSMQELAKLEQENWPQISPVVNLDLIKTNIDQGPWAMAMTPIHFCKRYRLLEEVRPQRREGMTRKEWDKIDVILKRGEANKIFALQLGPVWKGVDKLPPYVRALFAVFAARMNADSASAAKLLAQLSASSTKELNFTGVDELIKKHENTKLVQQVVQSHAYVATVMATMLQEARQDGVQASAEFLWLKPIDRRLWYTLNTVGRQTPFVEVAGIFAHWVAEKEAGRRLAVPMVDEATKALDIALKEVVYRPDEA